LGLADEVVLLVLVDDVEEDAPAAAPPLLLATEGAGLPFVLGAVALGVCLAGVGDVVVGRPPLVVPQAASRIAVARAASSVLESAWDKRTSRGRMPVLAGT
jgi:hypothetical protein